MSTLSDCWAPYWNKLKRGFLQVQKFQFKAVFRSAGLKVFMLAGVLLSGCASQPKVSIEEQVGNRALEWTNALIALDYDLALTFMTPSYQNSPRASMFKGDFSGAGFWRDAELKWVRCDDENPAPADVVSQNSPGRDMEPVDPLVAPAAADDCVVTSWENCGKSFTDGAPVMQTSSAVNASSRCEVRVILSFMKPPEMSLAMPIVYDTTWLNLEGVWYQYRK